VTWIKYVPFEEATGQLRLLYNKYMRANETVANIISAHSLRPHLLEGHMAFYRAVLGHSANQLPLWFLEAVGVYVSTLNGCNYCINHHSHFGGLAFDGNQEAWNDITDAITSDRLDDVFDSKMLALMDYARKVTLAPQTIDAEVIQELRNSGADDGEILEVNQVSGYFAYANRTVLGLGVTLNNEVHAD